MEKLLAFLEKTVFRETFTPSIKRILKRARRKQSTLPVIYKLFFYGKKFCKHIFSDFGELFLVIFLFNFGTCLLTLCFELSVVQVLVQKFSFERFFKLSFELFKEFQN